MKAKWLAVQLVCVSCVSGAAWEAQAMTSTPAPIARTDASKDSRSLGNLPGKVLTRAIGLRDRVVAGAREWAGNALGTGLQRMARRSATAKIARDKVVHAANGGADIEYTGKGDRRLWTVTVPTAQDGLVAVGRTGEGDLHVEAVTTGRRIAFDHTIQEPDGTRPRVGGHHSATGTNVGVQEHWKDRSVASIDHQRGTETIAHVEGDDGRYQTVKRGPTDMAYKLGWVKENAASR